MIDPSFIDAFPPCVVHAMQALSALLDASFAIDGTLLADLARMPDSSAIA